MDGKPLRAAIGRIFVVSVITTLGLLLAISINAQTPPPVDDKQLVEFGNPEELKGITRIFIYSDLTAERHDELLKVLKRAELPLSIVASPNDAEVFLMFRVVSSQSSMRVTAEPGINSIHGDIRRDPTTAEMSTRFRGVGIAYVKREKVLRILFNLDQRKSDRTYEKPWKIFAEEFVKAYKRVNAIK